MLYGRLTVVAGDPGEVDAIPPPQERPLHPGEIPGLRAVYCLVDRTIGRAAALSIWESREAMEAAETRGDDQRNQAVQNSGGTLVGVDRMEVDRLAEQARSTLPKAEIERIRDTYRSRLARINWRDVHSGDWANFEVIERLDTGARDLTMQKQQRH